MIPHALLRLALVACPICFGDPDSKQVHGARVGVIVLLAITLGMLSAIGMVARSWAVRARQLDARRATTAPASPVINAPAA